MASDLCAPSSCAENFTLNFFGDQRLAFAMDNAHCGR